MEEKLRKDFKMVKEKLKLVADLIAAGNYIEATFVIGNLYNICFENSEGHRE